MAIAKFVLSLTFLSFISLSSPHTISFSFLRAAEILASSGHLSMSLTLQLASKTITLTQSRHHAQPLTIFSPSDEAFAFSGQPSLSLLEFHLAPLSLHLRSLRNLPFDSRIPTLSPNRSLILTSYPSDCNVSLNGVKLTHKPIYNDGFLTIYETDEFFNPGYRVSDSFKNDQDSTNPPCGFSSNESINAFEEASKVLRSRGSSVMASFLELQLLGFDEKRRNNQLTLFAPFDVAMMDYVGNVSEYLSLFLRHAVPCKISRSDLVGSDSNEGLVLKTFQNGFEIHVTKSDDANDFLKLNGVVLSSPDMYYGDWLVVHGIDEVLPAPERLKEEIAPHHSEF